MTCTLTAFKHRLSKQIARHDACSSAWALPLLKLISLKSRCTVDRHSWGIVMFCIARRCEHNTRRLPWFAGTIAILLVKAFAGSEYELPVFEPEARRLLSKVEPIARHYDVKRAPQRT